MEFSKKHIPTVLIGLLITAIFSFALLLKFNPLEALKLMLFDFNFKLRGSIPNPDAVVIAAIDDKSLEVLGRWPWTRDKLAMLVNKLSDAGAEIITFDIILSESERNDPRLGAAIRRAGNVILPVVFDFERGGPPIEDEHLINAALISVEHADQFRNYRPITALRVLRPVPQLIREVMTLGHINMFPDSDGTLRWESLIIAYNGHLFPSVTLQSAATFLGVPLDRLVLRATEGVMVGKRYIPTDPFGRLLINYYGSNQTFKYISIVDIMQNKVDPELLRGKVVLIGATAVGIYDLRVTPFSPAMPGVEKHASVITSIIENNALKAVAPGINLSILIVSGLLFSVFATRLKALWALLVTIAVIFTLFASTFYLFSHRGLWIDISYASLNILFIFIFSTAYSYAVEERYSRRIRAMFSSYVTEKVVNELIKNPDMARLGGERREITILFSDVRGFTTFSEKHAPEEVVAILNEYLGAMTEIVFKWEGTLDKFIGDAILAFWGAPMRQERHAELAVKCAIEMIKRVKELQQKWAAEGKAGLDIGIGINTGEVIVGNIGAEGKKMDYTVIGDHVNLGSRVESLTRKYNVHILITEFVLERLRASIESRALGHVSVKGLEKVIVKGKEQPVGIFEIKTLGHEAESVIEECAEDKVVKFKEK